MTCSPPEFIAWLEERCLFLDNLETEANRVLEEDKDTDKYRALMCQKAMFLQALPDEAEERMGGLPASVAAMTADHLERFAASAGRAMDIGSVFFMSALLYPDDHKPGQPNNLRLLTEDLKKALAMA